MKKTTIKIGKPEIAKNICFPFHLNATYVISGCWTRHYRLRFDFLKHINCNVCNSWFSDGKHTIEMCYYQVDDIYFTCVLRWFLLYRIYTLILMELLSVSTRIIYTRLDSNEVNSPICNECQPKSVSISFGTVMKKGSSRQSKRYPTT